MSENSLRVKLDWLGGRRVEATARGNRVVVDQIQGGDGEGKGFRPTELLLSALGSCMMGNILGFCENMEIPIERFSIGVEGVRMESPMRVSEIRVEIDLVGDVPPERVETLKRVARGCRIHNTLSNPPAIDLDLRVSEGAARAEKA